MQPHPALAGQAKGAYLVLSSGPDAVFFSQVDGPGEPGAAVLDISTANPANFPPTIIDEYDDEFLFGGS